MASPNSDPRYQGYIAKSYTYFYHDPYFSNLLHHNYYIIAITVSILITFICLNLSIPILSITRGKTVYERLTKMGVISNSRMHKATLLVIIIVNIMYFILTLTTNIKRYPTILRCYPRTESHSCGIPQTTTTYDLIIGTVITKVVILPVALMIEVVVAIHIAKGSLAKNRRQRVARFTLVKQTFIIWQLLVFIQMTGGLVIIPLLLLTLVSPAHTLLFVGVILLSFMMLIFILTTIPLPTLCKFQLKVFLLSILIVVETLFVAILIISAALSYFMIVKHGVNMTGTKGFILSLIPTLPFPIFVWIIKKKFFKRRNNNKMKSKNCSKRINEVPITLRCSLSTEEEMIRISSSDGSTED